MTTPIDTENLFIALSQARDQRDVSRINLDQYDGPAMFALCERAQIKHYASMSRVERITAIYDWVDARLEKREATGKSGRSRHQRYVDKIAWLESEIERLEAELVQARRERVESTMEPLGLT